MTYLIYYHQYIADQEKSTVRGSPSVEKHSHQLDVAHQLHSRDQAP